MLGIAAQRVVEIQRRLARMFLIACSAELRPSVSLLRSSAVKKLRSSVAGFWPVRIGRYRHQGVVILGAAVLVVNLAHSGNRVNAPTPSTSVATTAIHIRTPTPTGQGYAAGSLLAHGSSSACRSHDHTFVQPFSNFHRPTHATGSGLTHPDRHEAGSAWRGTLISY